MSAASLALLAACSPGGGGSNSNGSSSRLPFWDMPWGSPGQAYIDAGKSITKSYSPSGDLPGATYQSIPWNNWLQTFSSAVAAGTGPAISTGGAFQSLQYYVQDAIHPADGVLKKLEASGKIADFLPGTIDQFKYDGVYTALPWNVDARMFWYRKSLLEAAGVDVPTSWDELHSAGLALKKNGVYGFIASGGGGGNAYQTLLSLVFNNEGGLFNAAGEPDTMTDRNLEAVEFARMLSIDGIFDPGSVSYSTANVNEQFIAGKAAMTIMPPDLDQSLEDPALAADTLIGSPLASPNGTFGTQAYTSDLMMYTGRGDWDVEAVEDFVVYYLSAMEEYWKLGVLNKIPVLQSTVDLPEVQENRNLVKAIEEWLPVGRPLFSNADQAFPEINAIDGGQAITTWAQEVIQAEKSAEEIMQTLQNEIEKVM
ncbi:ABC transporter substrate-binding protein [Microbacterium sp. AK031]|uniref:ABC transporter substrate-binding protein n=1 Tax=Microbacterium sp. AK031 TaxID=2723076 RepID=UPI0021676698|nr:extracellular solute-binding protein [Microbacterium sp. AK031]MCS3844121.1 multiple sugar transport system substrate-binding protein [Microbacterium sp. AK031]